jgi:hypothetical protein
MVEQRQRRLSSLVRRTKAEMEAEIGDLYAFIRASIDRQNAEEAARIAKDKRDGR